MRSWRDLVPGGVCIAVLSGMALPLEAQRIPFDRRFFNEQVLRPSEQPVVPIYEGYYQNDDDTYDICFGYFNLNMEESIDIPLGEGNFIEPSQYDGHQPTHFTPVPGMTDASPFTSRFRRIFCGFTVTVPASFEEGDQVWWTLQRDGQEPVRTPGTVNVEYVLEEPESTGRGDRAPTLRFSENGPRFQGRRGMTAPALAARVGQPLDLGLWIEHPPTSRGGMPPAQEPVWVGWVKYKGPGNVSMSPAEQRIEIDGMGGVARASATFDEPGEYELLVQAINTTAAFEFHCCWTNGYVPVTVTP